jgi:type IV secretory pathway VirB10-like protein
MRKFTRTRCLRLMAGCTLLAWATLSHAQYLWLDEKGVKQLSDRPPPPSTPASRILKAPAAAPGAALLSADAPAPTPLPASPPAVKGPPTLAERNADFRKRAKEQAEREQKAAEEAQRKADIAANCDAARKGKQTLDSGVRISTQENNGERGIMNDAQRAQETRKANKVLDGCH